MESNEEPYPWVTLYTCPECGLLTSLREDPSTCGNGHTAVAVPTAYVPKARLAEVERERDQAETMYRHERVFADGLADAAARKSRAEALAYHREHRGREKWVHRASQENQNATANANAYGEERALADELAAALRELARDLEVLRQAYGLESRTVVLRAEQMRDFAQVAYDHHREHRERDG